MSEMVRIPNGNRWPIGWDVFLVSREPRIYEAAGYRFTLRSTAPRWEVLHLPTGRMVDHNCGGLRIAVDVAYAHSQQQRPPEPGPEVTQTELSNFLYNAEISYHYPDTDAGTLLAHFEIRKRPEAIEPRALAKAAEEAAERQERRKRKLADALTMSDWEKLHETAQRVMRAMEDHDG